VINICFHGIGRPGRDLEPGEDRYWVGEDTFLRILDEVADRPDVRVSFDDGNASDITTGLPALQERGLTATFFVLAGRLGSPGSLDEGEVRELHRRGMAVGSHGMHHRPWRRMSPGVSDEELVEARERIADAVGAPVLEAACPLGAYDRALLRRLRRLGYVRVHTSDRRHAREGAWLQPRFSARREDTAQSLRADVLSRPGAARRVRLSAIGLVKSWR
jgi:peptidoglycan/xylan/chitin deacetylase (PgdA/CDA1 family)